MERPLLPFTQVAPSAHERVAQFHRQIVDEVSVAVDKDKVVVVGMAQNPVVKKARRILKEEGIDYTYLEYGSYFSSWKPRLAIKLWAGFPTFPMIFIDGKLVGGAAELSALRAAGSLPR